MINIVTNCIDFWTRGFRWGFTETNRKQNLLFPLVSLKQIGNTSGLYMFYLISTVAVNLKKKTYHNVCNNAKH